MAQVKLALTVDRGTSLEISNNELVVVWPEGNTERRKVITMTDAESEAVIAGMKAAKLHTKRRL